MRRLLAVAMLAVAACSSGRATTPQTFEIHPVPPSLTSGNGRASLNGQGDLVLEISVRGPVEEISSVRPGLGPGQGNLLWHLVDGTCDALVRGEGRNVLDRWTVLPQSQDAMDFRYVVSHGVFSPASGPHAVAAFKNGGGGPLYACGDVLAMPSN